jgi:hypothetical protein
LDYAKSEKSRVSLNPRLTERAFGALNRTLPLSITSRLLSKTPSLLIRANGRSSIAVILHHQRENDVKKHIPTESYSTAREMLRPSGICLRDRHYDFVSGIRLAYTIADS